MQRLILLLILIASVSAIGDIITSTSTYQKGTIRERLYQEDTRERVHTFGFNYVTGKTEWYWKDTGSPERFSLVIYKLDDKCVETFIVTGSDYKMYKENTSVQLVTKHGGWTNWRYGTAIKN